MSHQRSHQGNFQRGVWFVLAAALLWGTTGTAQAFAPSGVSPLTVGSVRLAIGGIALLGIAWSRGALRGSQPWSRWRTALAACCIAGYQVFFFAGVESTGVASGTIVAIGSAPVLAGAFAFLMRGERPGKRWVVATALTVVGTILLAASNSEFNVQAQGVLLALGAGACYALYAVTSKALLELHPPDAVMAVVFSLGAVLLAPFLFLGDLNWLAQTRGLLVALHLGLVATTLSYVLFARGLQLVPVATAVTLSLAEPLTAGLLGVFLLGEMLSFYAWIGILLIFSGLALLSYRSRAS
jgi:DME family drug/metabolite transporter